MLKTTIGLLTFFLTLIVGLFAAIVWIRSSQESCGFASHKVEKVDVFYNSTPAVKSEPAGLGKIAACENPNPMKQYKYPRKNNTIKGGVVNQWITCGVLPEQPVCAKSGKPSGDVILDVLVDESGEIIQASLQSGDILLGSAAIKAAYQSRTTPRLLGGESVKVRGVLIYRFDGEKGASLPKNFPTEKSVPLKF